MGRWYRSTAYAISAASGILLALPVHVHADEFVMQIADQDDYKDTQLFSASQTWKIGLYLIPFDLTIVAFAMCKHVGHPKQRLLYKTAVGFAALGHVLSSLLHNSFLWALALRYGILVFIISVHVMLRMSCTFGSAEDQHAKSKSRSVVLKFQRDTRRRPKNSRYSSGKHSQDTKAPAAAPIGKTQMVIQVCPEDDRVGKTMHSRKLVKAVLSKTPAESHEYHATRKLLKESGYAGSPSTRRWLSSNVVRPKDSQQLGSCDAQSPCSSSAPTFDLSNSSGKATTEACPPSCPSSHPQQLSVLSDLCPNYCLRRSISLGSCSQWSPSELTPVLSEESDFSDSHV